MIRIMNRKVLVLLHLWAFALGLVASTLLLTSGVSQDARAQLIAYEGFDYDTGDLLDVAGGPQGGPLGGGTGWTTAAEPNGLKVYDGWYYEGIGPVDAGDIVVEDNPAGWGYKDSQGNDLLTSGRTLNVTNWANVIRQMDLSGVDANLLSTTVEGREEIGTDGTTVWVSFLGLGTETGGTARTAMLGLGGPHLNEVHPGYQREMGFGRPYTLQTDGTQEEVLPTSGSNNAWGIADNDRDDPNSVKATGDPATDKVFYVAKINFGAGEEFEGDFDELVDVWINPDLGPTEPVNADRAISDFVVYNFGLGAIRPGGNADTYFDEIRIGLTYADVAPIAAPAGGGDFDGDGDVDGADFLKWQTDLGGAADLANWQSQYGTTSGSASVTGIPEPSSLLLLGGALVGLAMCRRA